MNIIRIPGLADYQETLELQEQLVRAHQEDPEREDDLLLLEHAGVYTIGRTRDHASLHPGSALPFPVHEINRGGQATYHGPGQLVGYPHHGLEPLRQGPAQLRHHPGKRLD